MRQGWRHAQRSGRRREGAPLTCANSAFSGVNPLRAVVMRPRLSIIQIADRATDSGTPRRCISRTISRAVPRLACGAEGEAGWA